MDWRDEGMILSARNHGETAVIVEVFTAKHGRHAGVVRGGNSRKMRPVLQPGNQVSLDWSARLETHLGSYRIEPMHARTALVMDNRLALEGLNTMTAILGHVLPEREAMDHFYDQTIALADDLGQPHWPASYARWECALLAHLGFALELGACAATGAQDDLRYVSPKSGRAVSKAGAGEWADRLLPLPAFLIEQGPDPAPAEVSDALRMTGYFLRHHVAASLGKDNLPEVRDRFASLITQKTAR